MSTKTTIKRIALVAAASLAIGGFSAVSPANAALTAAGAGATSNSALYPTQGAATSIANSAFGTVNGQVKFEYEPTRANDAAAETLEWVVDVTGGTIVSNQSSVSTAEAGETNTITVNTAANKATLTIVSDGDAAETLPVWSLAFTSAAAGTSTVTVSTVDGTSGARTVVAAGSIVWSAEAAYSTSALSTAVQGTAYENASTTVTYAVSTAGTDATIVTATASPATLSLAPKWTASLSGPGYMMYGGANVGQYTSISAATDLTPDFTIVGDGRAGESVLTVTANGTSIGTRKVVFHGTTVAKIEVTQILTIAKAGGAKSGSLVDSADAAVVTNVAATTETSAGATNLPAVAIKATDKDGNVINVATTMSSSNGAVIVSGTTDSFIDTGAGTYAVAYGVQHATYTSASTAKSGDKAELTYSYINSDGTVIKSAPITVTIGGSVAKEVISADASIDAGAPLTVTIKATDSSGNPVYDGAASPALSFSKTVGGSFGADIYVGGSVSNSANTLFAPVLGGDLIITATGTDAAKTKLSATVSVNGDGTSALALDAANAATDAANNAYDEAQNATQAASDALAAVTALAAQVKSLIASVKKLTAAVAKLKK